jgi:gliding motility-associated-like protein
LDVLNTGILNSVITQTNNINYLKYKVGSTNQITAGNTTYLKELDAKSACDPTTIKSTVVGSYVNFCPSSTVALQASQVTLEYINSACGSYVPTNYSLLKGNLSAFIPAGNESASGWNLNSNASSLGFITSKSGTVMCSQLPYSIDASEFNASPTTHTLVWQTANGTYTGTPSNGIDYRTFTTNATGVHTLTVIYRSGCLVTDTYTVSTINDVTSSYTATNVICNGQNNGSFSVTASTGTMNSTYNYLISPGSYTTNSSSNLSPSTYTYNIANTINPLACKTTGTFIISQPAVLATMATITNSVMCKGMSTASITANPIGGNLNYSYLWSDGITTYSTQGINNIPTGIYSLTVMDSKGCSATSTLQVEEPALAITSTVSGISNVLCFGASTGSASILVSGGTGSYTYTWMPGNSINQTATSLSANEYTVISTDANGCLSSKTLSITQPTSGVSISSNTQTNLSCHSYSNALAEVTATGGTGSYTYSWSPSSISSVTNTANNLAAGTITAVVIDANNCSATQTFVITEPAALITNITNTTQAGCNLSDGSATYTTTGGTAAYTYTWITPTSAYNTNANTINSLSAGINELKVTDAKGCTYSLSITITNPNTPVIATTATSVYCYGQSTGAITTTVTAGSACTYSWSNGALAANINDLPAGIYVLTVKDASNCVSVETVSITEPIDGIRLAIGSINNITCYGTSTGSASVNATGGSPAYTYTWLPSGGNTAMATNLTAQTYTVLASDNGACIIQAIIPITNLTTAALEVVTESNKGIVCEQKNGVIKARVTGGTPAYNYAWNTGTSNTETLSDISEGTYSLVVTDAYGCKDTLEVTLNCKYELIIPQLITPNGDGKNDKLEIKAIADYPNNKVEIFNRWGNLVYVKLNYNNEWDGKSNVSISSGKELLPAGTYYVVIDFGDGGATKPYHGFLQLQY